MVVIRERSDIGGLLGGGGSYRAKNILTVKQYPRGNPSCLPVVDSLDLAWLVFPAQKLCDLGRATELVNDVL